MFGTDEVIPLWIADMDFAAPPAVTRALAERAAHPVYGYTQYPDSLYESLIDWLRRRHGWEVQREWIMMCPGVVPSLHAAIMAFTEPGESVIVQPPVYFPFFSAVTNTGRTLLQNPLRMENGHYAIDFDHLEQCAAKARHAVAMLTAQPGWQGMAQAGIAAPPANRKKIRSAHIFRRNPRRFDLPRK